jgi:hypothetical protein
MLTLPTLFSGTTASAKTGMDVAITITDTTKRTSNFFIMFPPCFKQSPILDRITSTGFDVNRLCCHYIESDLSTEIPLLRISKY